MTNFKQNKKKIPAVLIIPALLSAALLLLTTCKQFLEDPEEFFSYWAAEVVPADFSFDKPAQTSAAGALCIPSADDVTLTVNLRNPKNFNLVMPASAADAGAVIRFPHLDPQPVYGTDYTLRQTADSTLTLVYKQAFLQRHEWSNGNIGPEITLTSQDGRTFGKKFSLNIEVNTAPSLVKAEGGIGKMWDGAKWCYVLIFRAEDMELKIGSKYVHEDIKQLHLTKEGSQTIVYNISSIDFTNKKFNADPPSPFYTGTVVQLASGDCEGIPPQLPTGDWLIYIKTDVEVSASSAAKTYTAQLSDEAGLFSGKADASTAKRVAAPIQIGETYPIGYHHASTENGEAATPYTVKCDGNGVTLQASCSTLGAVVSYTIYDITSGTDVQKGEGSGASPLGGIRLPTPPVGTQIKYKVVLKATAAGFAENTREVYYTLEAVNVITVDAAAENPSQVWKKLKDAVVNAHDDDIIIVKGTIKATKDGTGSNANYGAIDISKNITIRGEGGAAVLDANKTADGKAQHRIFVINGTTTLKLENLTLTGGIAPAGADGGGIFISGGCTVNLTNCTVTDCQGESGGGIFNRGTLTVSGGSFTKNKATARNGGAICNMGTLSLQDGCTVGGSDAADANEAQYGAGIYTEGGTVTMTGCTLARNKAVTEGGGICAKKDGSTAAAVTITGGTIEANTAAEFPSIGFGGGISINEGCTLTIQGNDPFHKAEIKDNTANVDGGGIYTGGTVTVKYCTITGNKTNEGDGGGVCAVRVSGGAPCTVTIEDCEIGARGAGNTAAASGGGVYGGAGAAVSMKNCGVIGNTAQNGGGIYAQGTSAAEKSTVTITSGSIGNTYSGAANKAIGTGVNDGNGGGIYVGVHAAVTQKANGRIFYNTANGKGSGVYVQDKTATFTLADYAEVVTNNDVYLAGNSPNNAQITVSGELSSFGSTDPSPHARITPEDYNTSAQVLAGDILTSGIPPDQNYTKFIVTQQTSSAHNWRVGNDGKLKDTRADFNNKTYANITGNASFMTTADIPNREILLGKVLFYKTGAGNFGIMLITEVNNTSNNGMGHITFDYKTFNSNGTVKKTGNGCEVKGGNPGFSFDLDNGSNVTDDFDFRLEGAKKFKPINRAIFYQWP